MTQFHVLAAPNTMFQVLKKPTHFFEWMPGGVRLPAAPFICLLHTCKGHMYCICVYAQRVLVLSGCT